MPMASPEIVMGSSLLALFVASGFGGQLGFWTILIAHIMFCLSFVVVTVRARLAGLDNNLEQAAMDLYATESQTFRRITFPLVFPGILGAALLSFSLSFDDFIITNLNAGNTTTFPMYVWGVAQRGVPMQVNVDRHADVPDLDRDRASAPSSTGGVRRRRSREPWRRLRSARIPGRGQPHAVLARRPGAPAALPALRQLDGPDSADLVVVGGGYLGLWTALLAKERDPERDVLLLEAATCGHAASGRNGGFCEASLTHGFGNGLVALARRAATSCSTMGRENLDGIERTVDEHGIDCDFVRAGSLAVATAGRTRSTALREEYDADACARHGDHLARRRRPARAGGLTDLPGRRTRPGRGDPRAGPAGLGAARRLPVAAACGSRRGRPSRGLARSGAGSPSRPTDGRVHAEPRRTRHQRVPAAAAPAPADDGARSTTTR